MENNELRDNETSTNGLMEFLTELGKALTASGISVVDITSILEKIAIAYKTQAEILVFPTMILIKIGEHESAPLNAANQKPGFLPLNQVSEIYELIYKAEAAEISPTEGKECLREILLEKHQFGPIGILIGYILFSVGIGLLLQPTPEQLLVSGVLGAIVGILLIISRGSNQIFTNTTCNSCFNCFFIIPLQYSNRLNYRISCHVVACFSLFPARCNFNHWNV